MIWLEFLVSTVIIVLAASRLAMYGDVISIRTRLGGMFIGTLLLSGATSLPELLTSINSVNQNVPDLTVGNIFGSCMFNMLMLAVLDVIYQRKRILRQVLLSHALTASIAVLLTGLAVFFIDAEINTTIGWIGLDAIILIVLYIFGMNLIYGNNVGDTPPPEPSDEELKEVPPLRNALIGFGISTLVLIVVTPILVSSSVDIAEELGVSAGFVGVALVGIVTSLPELVTTISAVRLDAYDLAIGNLFGSNIFNIFALGLTDVFYTKGDLLSDIDSQLALAGSLALTLTAFGLVGNLAKVKQRLIFVDIDAFFIIIVYIVGMILLYSRGLVG
jgi:cation:H+ antiporter